MVTLLFAYEFSGLRNLKSPCSNGSLKLSVTLYFLPLQLRTSRYTDSGPPDRQLKFFSGSYSYSYPLVFGPMSVEPYNDHKLMEGVDCIPSVAQSQGYKASSPLRGCVTTPRGQQFLLSGYV